MLDEWAGLGTPDLRAEREHIPAIAEDDGAVHGRQPADRVGCLLEGDVARALADQVAELREGRRDGVGDGHDRLAPRFGAVRHDQQRAAVLVGAHREREWQQDVVRMAGCGIESQQCRDKIGTLGRQRSLRVHHLDLIAFQHRHVRELAVWIGAAVFDH